MRAVDSTTAISLAVMWSGLAPTESRTALHSAPLLWEYAHAAGLDTAYWTSQNLLFGNSGEWLRGLPLTREVSATQLDAEADLDTGADDAKLVDRSLAEIEGLHEPFVGVVHLANTHFPYAIDDADAPFQPQSDATGPGYEQEITNRYHDAIWHQDRAFARLIQRLRSTPLGKRTVVVYLSDHGEQFYEHGILGHTATLYEQEVHVPAWIDAPPGTLSDAEEDHLRSLTDAPLTTLDVLPTLLDLAGLWDDPSLAPFRAKMPGASLLRGGSPVEPAARHDQLLRAVAVRVQELGSHPRHAKAHRTPVRSELELLRREPRSRGEERPGRGRLRRPSSRRRGGRTRPPF